MDSTINFAGEVEGATRSGNSRGRADEDDRRAAPGDRRLLPVPSGGKVFPFSRSSFSKPIRIAFSNWRAN